MCDKVYSMCKLKCNLDESKEKEVNEIYMKYAPLLKPNKKSITDILEYIKLKYPIESEDSYNTIKAIEWTVMNNFFRDKSRDEIKLEVKSYKIRNEGTGSYLYELQKQEFLDVVDDVLGDKNILHPNRITDIKISVELYTEYISVDGSQTLADEIIILRGLDKEDLKNKYLVNHYIQTLKKIASNSMS